MRGAAIALGILCGLATLPAAEAQDEGLYTPEQARRGHALYRRHCASCHGAQLEGVTAPPLSGPYFAASWGHPDMTVGDLFYVQSTTMPPRMSNVLTESQHADVLAYLLERSGYPAGGETLTPDSTLLEEPLHSAGVDSSAEAEAPAFLEGEAQPADGGPTQEELDAAPSSKRNWLYHTHDYTGSRYVPVDQIDVGTAPKLQSKCVFQMGAATTFQTGPIVYERTIYLTTDLSTFALDATDCRPRWRHDWQPLGQQVWSRNRGVAIKEGRVVRGTPDGYLISLSAATGGLIWARKVADARRGETFTMAPMIVDDLVLIGPAGSENNIQGWVGAFSVEDGASIWRFNTIPQEGEPGFDSWQGRGDLPMGGGAVWTPFSLDREKGELYVAVTNPAPDLPAHLRPGANLYTNAIVALDFRTGKLRWYEQMIANDSHDYDLTQVSPVFKAKVEGRERQLVAVTGKDGRLRTIDRVTQEPLYVTAVTTLENVDEPVTSSGLHACPGTFGGVEWNGPAYNPELNLLYVPAVDWCSTFTAAEEFRLIPGKLYMGGTVVQDANSQGWITAVDAVSGEVRWRYRSPEPMVAAVTATAGGVLFTGELTGDFLTLDAATGEVLYRFNTGGPIGGGIVTYEEAGRQYVGVTSGIASSFWQSEFPGAATFFLFALPED